MIGRPPTKVTIMQIQEPNVLTGNDPIGSAPPVSVDISDHVQADLEPLRQEALLPLRPSRERAMMAGMVAGALLVGVAFGWAGCLGWKSYTVVAAAPPAARSVSLRQAEPRLPVRTENIRKQAPSVTASINASKAPRLEGDSAKSAAAMLGSPAASAEPRPLLTPAPETRPTTIEGWTVLDVRGGTAVLQGPDGVRTVAQGDTVPGIGRIDSIVRWGNRWIVATANGLIATP
jgi:hypothetical protein